MANFSVRKLDDTVYQHLRERAAKHGLSMEEEARRIITQAVSGPSSIGDIFKQHFGQRHGVDLKCISQRTPHDPMDV